MDTASSATYIARSEARRIKPVRDVGELDELDAVLGRKLPAFRISASADTSIGGGGGLVAEPLSSRDPRHDNAPRLFQLCRFLNTRVLNMIEPEAAASIVGNYRVELHDSYSYLPGRRDYSNVFSFGRALDAPERDVALLPDPYHMDNFGNGHLVGTASADTVRWQDKDPILFFAGTTTGDRDPALNARLRACAWASGNIDKARMHITNVAQMSIDDIVRRYGDPVTRAMLHEPFSIEDHFRYRYVANIVGNTACWSRVPMIMSSGSVMVHVRHADATWYYPLLREGRHYVGADSVEGPDLTRAVSFCRTYDKQCRAMVTEANALSRELFSSSAIAATYAAELFQECGYLYGR
jgi:hypothetical protein